MAPETFDVKTARGYFPALQQDQIYMDNAGKWTSDCEIRAIKHLNHFLIDFYLGGSQVLGTVADS